MSAGALIFVILALVFGDVLHATPFGRSGGPASRRASM